jgi:diguanylate cyclase (GGDEF)-like protein/PAS domain S-box-containing protein
MDPWEGSDSRAGTAWDQANPPEPTPAQLAASLGSRPLLEALPECLLLVGADGRILFANLEVESLTGFTRQELTGKAVELLIAVDPLERESGAHIESVCRRADGGEIPVTVRVGRLDDRGTPLVVVLLSDATELRAGRDGRFEAEAKYRSLAEQIPGVVYLDPVDEEKDSIYVSPQVQTLLGVTQSEWMKDPYCWSHHLHPDDSERVWEAYLKAYNEHIPLEQEYRMLREDGAVRWVLELANPINDERGRPWLFQGVLFDITERRLAEEQANYLAYHDELTGLPNRRKFESLLEGAVAGARRTGGGVGVLVLDLDNFGFINESLGYRAGDVLFRQLAERLRGCAPDPCVIARQGGDKFILCVPGPEPASGETGDDAALVALESVAARINAALLEPFDLEGLDLVVTVSTGLSLLSHDADDPQALLRNADAAMHEAKRHGQGSTVLYIRSDQDPKEKLQAIARLRRAVELRHWVLHYQPVVDLHNGAVIGVEALIRWQDPDGRIVSPGEFIPLAEELGLIEAIGDWVIHEVAAQQAVWKAAGVDLDVGFNLSLRQFRAPALAEKILEELQAANVDPHSIVLEITESAAMADPDRTQTILASLHGAGLEVAIDDFGTGYSSLSRLRHMPVDVLKIDQSFIRDVDKDPALAGMVRAMIQLAQSLDMFSLAEGIETPEELAFLRANGCRLGQGFLMSRPVPASEIAALVEREGGLFPAEADTIA